MGKISKARTSSLPSYWLLQDAKAGIILGSRLSIRVNHVHVRNAIAVMLAVVAGKLVLQL
jgi:hypothetical protein